jgi:hypothetical protein
MCFPWWQECLDNRNKTSGPGALRTPENIGLTSPQITLIYRLSRSAIVPEISREEPLKTRGANHYGTRILGS